VIAKAKNRKSPRLNQRCPSRVCLLSSIGKMLRAIEFDHQLCRVTHKIWAVISNRYLASESDTVRPMIAPF
jgi:hypothetical protein